LECGGNFTLAKNGKKDCSACLLPHGPDGYEYVLEMLKRNDGKESQI
jgi:Zn-finger protein